MGARRLSVIYDGDCGFCMASLRWVRRLDWLGTLNYLDFHERDAVASRFPALRDADFEKAMYVAAPDGRSWRGFYGFRRIAWKFPATWLIAPFLYVPGVAWIGDRVYGWIAANRHRLPFTGGNACELPDKNAKP